jgi:hypothetical protein
MECVLSNAVLVYNTVRIANRAMTLFTSLGPSADCRGPTQVPIYQVQTGHASGAASSVSQRGFSLGWGLQGKVARTPHQSKGSGGTVCALDMYSSGREPKDKSLARKPLPTFHLWRVAM